MLLFMTLFKNQYRIESARKVGWDYRSRDWYFVTICTKGRQCTLGRIVDGIVVLTPVGRIAEGEMNRLSDHYSNVVVDRHVIMPNHVHALVVIDGEHQFSPGAAFAPNEAPPSGILPGSLSAIVRSYKAGVQRLCHAAGIEGFEWQPRFYDRILRSNEAVTGVRDYIDGNPEAWCDDPDNPLRVTPR